MCLVKRFFIIEYNTVVRYFITYTIKNYKPKFIKRKKLHNELLLKLKLDLFGLTLDTGFFIVKAEAMW